jgi:uncharacterized protein YneF (UPF0154 family)
MYDYLIIGLVCLVAGYFGGAFVVARKVQRFFAGLPKEERDRLKQAWTSA